MNYKRILFYTILVVGVALDFGCSKKSSSSDDSASSSSSRYLYVSSGVCYSGSNVTFTAATSTNVVYMVDINSGQRVMTLADYQASPANPGVDSPAGMVDGDANSFYVLVEGGASGRRIEKVQKADHGTRSLFSNNTVAMSAQVRQLLMTPSGDFMIDKTSGIEYITSADVRINAPFINPSVAPCAASNTLISKFKLLSNDKVVFSHAAAGQNRIGILPATGGTTCTTVQAAPNVNSYPTAMFYDSANFLLFVAYAGNSTATDLNSIYAYTINETTGAITNPQKIYDASLYPGTYPSGYGYLLYGISDMYYDAQTSTVYIATGITTATPVINYAIEKFTYDATKVGIDNMKVLTRVGTTPFYPSGGDTKCISSMMISN